MTIGALAAEAAAPDTPTKTPVRQKIAVPRRKALIPVHMDDPPCKWLNGDSR